MALNSLTFSGSMQVKPTVGQSVPSSILATSLAQISQSLTKQSYQIVSGDGTSNDTLDMGSVSNCKFLFIQKPNQSNLKLRVTHADGTNQVLGVGKLLVLETAEKPITAIDFTHTGDFEVLLGEW